MKIRAASAKRLPAITPFLWFDHEAEQAARFYVSIFKGGKILSITRYPEGGPGPVGSVMTVNFRLLGQEFVALNGGPVYTITPAVSFVVECRTQREVDYYWRRLSAGGKKVQCGWLQDKFGVSWQIVPTEFFAMIEDKDAARRQRMFSAMLGMVKLDIKKLRAAARR
ncbi:MAG: VOC family protein [Opitutaceae bacterium]|nr:VOC family protein [Opitutaceae bacterium]